MDQINQCIKHSSLAPHSLTLHFHCNMFVFQCTLVIMVRLMVYLSLYLLDMYYIAVSMILFSVFPRVCWHFQVKFFPQENLVTEWVTTLQLIVCLSTKRKILSPDTVHVCHSIKWGQSSGNILDIECCKTIWGLITFHVVRSNFTNLKK